MWGRSRDRGLAATAQTFPHASPHFAGLVAGLLAVAEPGPVVTIGGRWTLRRQRPARHDVRFYGRDGHISAVCEPCRQSVWLENGHTADELKEFERQHSEEAGNG